MLPCPESLHTPSLCHSAGGHWLSPPTLRPLGSLIGGLGYREQAPHLQQLDVMSMSGLCYHRTCLEQ